jgi:hypothetical protein
MFLAAQCAIAGFVVSDVRPAMADSTASVSKALTPTSSFAGASGKLRVRLHAKPVSGATGTQGSFSVSARHLPTDSSSFDLIVGGAKVGSVQANSAGNGSASFSTTPHGRSALLGVDPRGKTVVVRDTAGSGADVLVGTVPDDDAGSEACCTTDGEGESECEDVSPDPTTGVVTCNGTIPLDANGAPINSCLPDPCTTTVPPPPPGTATVCCVADSGDEEAQNTECDDGLDQCAANGGVLVQVQLPADFQQGDDPCDLNPCQSVTPNPPPPPSFCCVAQSSDDSSEVEAPECEDMSADACASIGAPPVNGACAYTDQSGNPASVPCP